MPANQWYTLPANTWYIIAREMTQIHWGVGWVEMEGEQIEVQLFVMRLCYSRKIFVMAFPTQRQEAFYMAHTEAFRYIGGVPKRLIYDNLTTAVKRILKGRERERSKKGLYRCAATTCLRVVFVHPARAMRRAEWRTVWVTCNATFLCPCSKYPLFRT